MILEVIQSLSHMQRECIMEISTLRQQIYKETAGH